MNDIADNHTCQAELNLRLRRSPERVENDRRELEALLHGRGFVTAATLESLRPDWDERYVRKLASGSPAIVSFPGSPGYCLAMEVDAKTLEHAGHSLLSQGRDMGRRGIRYLRIAKLRRAADALTTPAS